MQALKQFSDVYFYDNTNMAFGDRLKAARKAAKMTQQALANKVGVSQGLISDIEKNVYDGSAHAAKMASVLNVDALYLSDGSNVKSIAKQDIAPYLLANSSNVFEIQLIDFYRKMSTKHKDAVFDLANKLYLIDNVKDSKANPYPNKPRKVKT